MSNDLIVKDNALIEAGYQLTANEQRLLLAAIAQIPKNQVVSDDVIYFVSVKDFIEFGVHKNTVYREIREAANRLYERSANIRFEDKIIKTRWVQQIIVTDKAFWQLIEQKDNKVSQSLRATVGDLSNDYLSVGIRFSTPIIPYITDLKSNFTQYLKKDIAGLKSAYSIRFYELLAQFQSTGYRKISLDDLRDMLELGKKYPLAADLRRRVIDTAVNELNAIAPLKVGYKLIKTGNKFTHIEFKFKFNKDAAIPLKKPANNSKPNSTATKDRHQSFEKKGLSDAQIKKLAIYKDQFVEANTHLLRDKNISYYDAFEDFKDQLRDPEHVGKFHLLAEFLALKKGDEPPKAVKKPAQSQGKAPKETAEVSKNKGLTAEEIDFFANHREFQIDHPVKSYEVGSKDHISYLKFRMDSAPGEFYKTDFDKYLK